MRKKIYTTIEAGQTDNNLLGYIYDFVMLIAIIASLVPLMFKHTTRLFVIIDTITAVLFIIDYILRLFTADFKLKKGIKSFFLYPFTTMAIIDLISITPSIIVLSPRHSVVKLFRLLRSFKVLRVFKAIRYSNNIHRIKKALKKQENALCAVAGFAFLYVFVSALLVFNVEPETFDTFFDAIYWAVVSLTTMGYGDIYPVSTA